MTFSLDPAPRADLLMEGLHEQDASGNFTGPWFDSSDVRTVRVAADFIGGVSEYGSNPPALAVQEAQFDSSAADPRIIRTQQISVTATSQYAAGDIDITARYFRVIINHGTPNDYCAMTVRKVV